MRYPPFAFYSIERYIQKTVGLNKPTVNILQLFVLFNNISDNLCKVRLCKAELVKKLKSRTAVTETIVHTDLCNLNRTLCAYNITNSVTETADNIVFLNGDDSALMMISLSIGFIV